MKRYITNQRTIAWSKPGRVPMGYLANGFQFNLIATVPGYLAFETANKIGKVVWWWISAKSAVEVDTLPLPPPTLPDKQVRLKFHNQIVEGANTGSFGIVPFSATKVWNKPHSVTLPDGLVELYRQLQSQEFYDANIEHYPCNNVNIQNKPGTKVNPHESFQWLFEHDNTKNYGAHFTGFGYSIPAQGCFGGNLVTIEEQTRWMTKITGVVAHNLPTIDQLYNRPDLVHFAWGVGSDGRTINPPCGSAFVLVLNPMGLQGVTNALNQQTEIWIQNRWRWL